jgi:hypothetical protein
MMALTARFFIVSVAYGLALLTAVTQLLFVGLCFLLGLVTTLMALPFFVIWRMFKQ